MILGRHLNNDWNSFIEKEREKVYFGSLSTQLETEYSTKEIYPPKDKIYRALSLCPLKEVKVVILGQDPYHTPGVADGLAFSVNRKVKSPSLTNILKELESDLDIAREKLTLEDWATQGVLLLNTVLTVRKGSPNSHKDIGWQIFTNNLITYLSTESKYLVFVLWGKQAQQKIQLIDENKHSILISPHPSPFSAHRGFFGSQPFSKVNVLLKEKGLKEIIW